MTIERDIRELLDARRFTREQAQTLIDLLSTSRAPTVIPFNVTPATWADQPAAATRLFGEAINSRAVAVDLSRFTEVRLTAAIPTAGATGAALEARALVGGTYVAMGVARATIDVAGATASPWLTIPPPFRTATAVDIFGSGGNGVADPVIGAVLLWLR